MVCDLRRFPDVWNDVRFDNKEHIRTNLTKSEWLVSGYVGDDDVGGIVCDAVDTLRTYVGVVLSAASSVNLLGEVTM